MICHQTDVQDEGYDVQEVPFVQEVLQSIWFELQELIEGKVESSTDEAHTENELPSSKSEFSVRLIIQQVVWYTVPYCFYPCEPFLPSWENILNRFRNNRVRYLR